jgi:hypothetical protein
VSTTPTRLSEMVQHLQALGQGTPSPAVRAEVEAHLFGKWQGIQVVAGRVLAAWGGRESVDAIWAWYLRLHEPNPRKADRQRKYRYWLVARREAGRCLAQCVTAEDAGWLLDFYFENAHRGWQHSYELGAAIAALPLNLMFPRIEALLRRGTREEQFAALAIVPYTEDPLATLQRLATRIDEKDLEMRDEIRRRIGWWSTPPPVQEATHGARKQKRSPAPRPDARSKRPQ